MAISMYQTACSISQKKMILIFMFVKASDLIYCVYDILSYRENATSVETVYMPKTPLFFKFFSSFVEMFIIANTDIFLTEIMHTVQRY